MGNNREKKHSHQFKENTNHGETRNGRLSQFKNHSSYGGERENEYINKEEEED